MRTLEASGAGPAPVDTTTQATEAAPATAPIATSTPQTVEPSTSEDAPAAASPSAKPAPPSALNRAETEAIGPSTDTPAANPDNTNGPVLVIMLLLTSGSRHPYKIEEKYLKKRNVKVENMDPYNISVYTLKELIWRDWREGTHFIPTESSYHSTTFVVVGKRNITLFGVCQKANSIEQNGRPDLLRRAR